MQLDGRYRFDNYVVGSANRLAVAAARAVAEAPGTTYNPLFIYSSPGLGKTHLLSAIGCQAAALQPTLRVDALTLDEFVRQLHAAVSVGEADAFRARYIHTQVLLIDDVQFLTGRRETQAEMLRLCQALQGSGRQIVLTSDRPPADIADVDERLVTRLAGGLLVDIGTPDYETRVAILETWCAERGARFADGVIEELARVDWGNVRELQGALNRLIAYQGVGGPGAQIGVGDVHRLFPERSELLRPAVARIESEEAKSRGPSFDGEYLSFLSDVAHVVARHVDPWRTRLAEAAAYWAGEGYRVGALERALRSEVDPGADELVAAFERDIERLRALEADAASVDPAGAGSEVFRDPERIADADALVARARAGGTPPAGPSATFTREAFEVGSSNELAIRSADAVVADPGRRFNPLFVHGASGVGKTHLVHAVGNGLVASDRALKVACVGAQELIEELIAALRDGSVERWRSRYRMADALLIDDVHFLAGKERTQEELFHVFNDLHAEGKQIVLSSDRPPRELADLEERLRSRFAGGLVVEIHVPDRTLRAKLYERYLRMVDADGDPRLLEYLADRPVASVREIAGTVHRLSAAADVAGVPISWDLAQRELEGPGAARAGAPPAVAAVDGFFLDDEKVVWDWPDCSGRLIEELR